jgi:hypothetical protein
LLGAYTHRSPFKRFSLVRGPDLPWQLTRIAILTVVIQWIYMIIATGVESFLGPVSLLKPPGSPPWIRDQKMRGWSPSMIHMSNESLPSDYKLINSPFSGTTLRPPHHPWTGSPAVTAAATSRAHDRRLLEGEANAAASLDDLTKLLPTIGGLVQTIARGHEEIDGVMQSVATQGATVSAPFAGRQAAQKQASPSFMAADQAESVEWPPFFEPQHLICQPASGAGASAGSPVVLALSRHGLGAIVRVGDAGLVKAEPFALEGVTQHGHILGAAWDARSGLRLLVARPGAPQVGSGGREERWRGELLDCPGQGPTELGGWACQPSASGASSMPLPGKPLAAAVFDDDLGSADKKTLGSSIAVMLESHPGKVLLLSEEPNTGWSLSGEIHLLEDGRSASADATSGLAISQDELFVTTAGGAIHRRRLRDGTSEMHPAPRVRSSAVEREFRGGCVLPTGDLVRLALRRASGAIGSRWVPELIRGA